MIADTMLAEFLKEERPEDFWIAQRERVLARLPFDRGPLPGFDLAGALAAAAVVAVLILGPCRVGVEQRPFDWLDVEAVELSADFDFLEFLDEV